MGLDMFLTGEKYFWEDYEHPKNNPMRDGFPLKREEIELGYWRKHPNLHGYIVSKFADGKDNCEPISLNAENLREILAAVEADELPHTEGFFFGQSQPEDKPHSIEILKKAIEWVEHKENNVSRSVIYEASW